MSHLDMVHPKLLFKIKSLFFAFMLLLTLQSSSAIADTYESALVARDAARAALQEYENAVKDCSDLTNSKNKLNLVQVIGIKLILDRAKTLLEECMSQSGYAEVPSSKLKADTAANPSESIDYYSDMVTEFEAYTNTVKLTTDDVFEMLPELVKLGELLANYQNDLSVASDKIQNFDSKFLELGNDVKNQIVITETWSNYLILKQSLEMQKEKFRQALIFLDGLDRLIDLEPASERIGKLLSEKIFLVDIESSILKLTMLSQASNATKPPLSPSSSKPKVMKITITCNKGSAIKKVTAIVPKCPPGFKKR